MAVSTIAPLLVLVSIWFPVLYGYFIPNVAVTDQIIARSRLQPSDSVLNEVKDVSFGVDAELGGIDCVSVADRLMKEGVWEIPGQPQRSITLPLASPELYQGPSDWQLQQASMIVPELLVRAYEQSGRSEYLNTARDAIMAWAKYERKAWLPKGFLWNDHAVAARVLVLSRFWTAYRHSSGFDTDTAGLVLQMAARSGQLLARSSQFTAATNHGVMQNLALLHAALVFPELPGSQEFAAVGWSRLHRQLDFYVSPEGVILEHSAEYQAFGVQLLGYLFRYLRLLNQPVPDDIAAKYNKAIEFLAAIRRPDGTVPLFGDSNGGRDWFAANPTPFPATGAMSTLAENSFHVFPISGYAVWSGTRRPDDPLQASHTLATWSYFPGHGHKHADELSVMIWAKGYEWITNTGYWPYSLQGRDLAESWPGSNAPHLLDEPALSSREAQLVSYGSGKRLVCLQMERKGPGAYSVDRQVIAIGPDLWIVLDSTKGPAGAVTTTTWTAAAGTTLTPDRAVGAFTFRAPDGKKCARLFLLGNPQPQQESHVGSISPFAGWQVVNRRPLPAPAVVASQPASASWSAVILDVAGDQPAREPGSTPSVHWTDSRHWEASLRGGAEGTTVIRSGGRVEFHDGPSTDTIQLVAPSDHSSENRQLQASFDQLLQQYPVFHSYLPYRFKASAVLLVLFLGQELVFRILCRGRYCIKLRMLSVFAWTAIGVWLSKFYF